MQQIINQIRKELRKKVDVKYKNGAENFFKEPIKIYGVRIPIVRQISKKYYQEIKYSNKEKIFELAETLLKSEYSEEITIALDWVYRKKDDYQKSDFKIFERWLKNYISNWGSCDDFCGHPLGYLLLDFPELIKNLNRWAKSKNKWLRRASAVSLIVSVRNKKQLKKIFEISDILLEDKDDLVQKGYGWALKEASNLYSKDVFAFVVKRKTKMPRTALRYAIEKMPKTLKQKAMS